MATHAAIDGPAITFSDAISGAPVRAFQWATVSICLLVLVSDGIDMQLLGTLAPTIIRDFGVDRGTFGIAMSAALFGFGLGAWCGGRVGDTIGRRYMLALAALIFSGATIGASRADGVWPLALWRVCSGLGFGAAYSNALAMTSEWLPQRWRPVVLSVLSVATPLGGAVVGWAGPRLAAAYHWRGAFSAFGLATGLLVPVVLAVLRDSPSFLLSRGRKKQAARAARRALSRVPALCGEGDDGGMGLRQAATVLDRANLRFNVGVGVAFAASALVAYGILNWSTTFLTSTGFTLQQAGSALSVAGVTSVIGSVAAGLLTRRIGSRRVLATAGALLVALMIALGAVLESAAPILSPGDRLLIMCLVGIAATTFSAAMSVLYIVLAAGYSPSCLSAGIGFGIFMSRVGAITASGFGGTLLDLGRGSVIPFFAVLTASAGIILVASFVIDRHIPRLRVTRSPADECPS